MTETFDPQLVAEGTSPRGTTPTSSGSRACRPGSPRCHDGHGATADPRQPRRGVDAAFDVTGQDFIDTAIALRGETVVTGRPDHR